MKVLSINLRKRLNSSSTHGAILQWLDKHAPDVVLIQEASAKSVKSESVPPGYRFMGGNKNVCVLVKRPLKGLNVELLSDTCLLVSIDYLDFYSIYLDAYSQESRALQLLDLKQHISSKDKCDINILCGDFNIAPRPQDGLVDNKVSSFNSDKDRDPLAQLMLTARLVDMGSLGEREFTIERRIGNSYTQFRCDLCLMDQLIAKSSMFSYDHEVRKSQGGFTDHSALIIEVPLTPTYLKTEPTTLIDLMEDEPQPEEEISIEPHKTAMGRVDPSPLAKFIVTNVLSSNRNAVRLLDYGCGRGRDLEFYNTAGVNAIGYDPYEPYGASSPPVGVFDVVSCAFVLNVIPTPKERCQVMLNIKYLLAPNGIALVAVRSCSEIEARAQKGKWERYNDGYWSNRNKRTFQRGMTKSELLFLAKQAGFDVHELNTEAKPDAATEMLVLKHHGE